MRNPENTKTAILEAAQRILIEDGVLALTIDEVARAATISKGGVLHHFPSKEALVLAVLQRELDRFDQDVERHRRQDPVQPGAYTRAYVRACAEEYERSSHNVGLSCMDQFRGIPATQDVVRACAERWQRRVEQDGLDPAVATLVRFAGDGIWLASLVGAEKPPFFPLVVEKLLDLTRTHHTSVYQADTKESKASS